MRYTTGKSKKAPRVMEQAPRYLLRGQVIWAKQLPNQPNDPHLPRPVVIVSTNARNKHYDSLIVVPMSHGIDNPHKDLHVYVPAGQGGIPKDGYVRCELVSTLFRNFLDLEKGPLGESLADKYMYAILRGIRRAIGDS